MPIAPWCWLSQVSPGAICLPLKPCGGGCSELGSAVTAVLRSRALQPGVIHRMGFATGTWGKRILSLGLNSLCRLQLPCKILCSLPNENRGNPELPQAGRWSQAEKPRFSASAPVPVFIQSCHTPQVPYNLQQILATWSSQLRVGQHFARWCGLVAKQNF